MGILKNPKEEAFVQKWHETGNKSEAFRYAFPKSLNWKDETVHSKASTLSKADKVQERYKELQEATAETHGITIESLLDELAENRRVALEAETPQASAANAATMGKARLCGLDVQKVENSVKVIQVDESDW